MFDFYDVGTKMKKIAGRFGTIGVILSVIYGFFTGYSIIKAGKIAVSVYDEGASVPADTVFLAIITGVIVMAIGCICSYLSAMLWYCMGECVDNSEKMLVELSSLKKGAVSEVSTNNTKPSASTNSGGYSLLGMASKRNNTTGEWLCKKCGAKNTKTAFFCKDCGEHK